MQGRLLCMCMYGLLVASATAIRLPNRQPSTARCLAKQEDDLVAAKSLAPKPPGFLGPAYKAAGLATTAAWFKVVTHTIRSNAPPGAIMPSSLHAPFARMGVLSVVPVIASAYAVLSTASQDSWTALSSDTCRRLNLALITAGVGSALWVGFAARITMIPGTNPVASHWQPVSGTTRAALIGSYGASAALSAAVWVGSLPEDVRKKPLTWPGRIADGVCKSLVTLAPANANDPVQVKYALLASSMLFFTAMPLVMPYPYAVCPSWAGRRCSRAFPAWTFLAAVSSFNLKEAAERGNLLADNACKTLSTGLTAFGALYLSPKVGSIFIDPSFPAHFKIVLAETVPMWLAAASASVGLTLRPDKA
jgi:hypothetical protein